MFIADGPRPMVLQGQKKIVRPSKPSNTIDANILPFVKYATGLNTNYGAGYLDWFQITDEFSGDEFWCPPSIKAMGVYINTDLNFNYWDAPAGLNRGVIQALDTAFSPTIKQAGSIYGKNWNYAINYPYDGIVLEGQKTFQVKPSAFDRVNVRRLFLRLERLVNKVARYYVYEPNNSYTRQRLVDTLDPIFQQVKSMGGLYDYIIKCSEDNNTAESIERNELHVDIGLKATRTAEFLMITFTNCGLRGNWSEYGL
jgi:phage tail sheath protein FI